MYRGQSDLIVGENMTWTHVSSNGVNASSLAELYSFKYATASSSDAYSCCTASISTGSHANGFDRDKLQVDSR